MKTLLLFTIVINSFFIATALGGPSGNIVFSHAELHYQKGTYGKLDKELREWLESTDERNTQYNKRVIRKEVDELAQAQLKFIDMDGNDSETVFVSYIPLSMTQNLIKEKKFTDD